VNVEKDHFVPMRDGVSLAVDLFTPDELREHAAILIVTPYKKDGVFSMPLSAEGRPIVLPIQIPEGINPMLLGVKPLVDAGYVVAVADARGTGFSEGTYDYYNLTGGPFDGYDLVEWLAVQPWCTGKVGMTGGSAAAVSCYITALTHPPHLVAMAPNMHPGDFYFDQWHIGGVFRFENRISWGVGQFANIVPIDPGDPRGPSYERKRAVYEDRFLAFGARIARGENVANLDWLTEMYEHHTYDNFWRERSFMARISEIDIPTLHGGVWYDHFGRGTLTCHDALNVDKRLFFGPGSLGTRSDLGDGGFGQMVLDWFDFFLRGTPKGVLKSSAARIYQMGLEAYLDEPVWPIPTDTYSLYLGSGPGGGAASLNDGVLSRERPHGEPSDVVVHDPENPVRTPQDAFDQSGFERSSLTFSTTPLADELEIFGMSRLTIHAACDNVDFDICVRLCDVDAGGRSKLLNFGALKASHRDSHERPSLLQPGAISEFEVEIWPVSNLFKKGHRVRVDISLSDFPFFENNVIASTVTIFHDPTHPSRLELMVPRRSEGDANGPVQPGPPDAVDSSDD
jgi:uncharacterized protein